jgi:hypothetical protein
MVHTPIRGAPYAPGGPDGAMTNNKVINDRVMNGRSRRPETRNLAASGSLIRRGLRIASDSKRSTLTSKALPLSYAMQDPISNNELEAGAQSASRQTRETLERGGKKILNNRPTGNVWLPLVIGGSVALVAVGYYLGRQYYESETRSGTERFLRELQNWIEEHSASLPAPLRDRLNATGSFLEHSLRRTPLERFVSQFRTKPRRFWDIFS